MSNEWTGNEMEFDEAPQRGVHRIRGDNIRFLEEGVEIEADCPNCQETTSIEIPWAETVALAMGHAVPPFRRVQGGYVALAPCHACIERLLQERVPEQQARRGATAQIDIEMNEVIGWVKRGRSAGKISKRQLAAMKNVGQRRAAAQPAQSQPARRRSIVPRARRRNR